MKPLIYLKNKGEMVISFGLKKDWFIRIPTIRHRLHKSASAAFTAPERMDLRDRKGLLYIDMSKKVYVFVSNELLSQYATDLKDYNGVKNTLICYPVGQIVKEHDLPLIEIPTEDQLEKAEKVGLAYEIKRKFGLET